MAGLPGNDPSEEELASAVMEYFAQHPQAMDTLAGITEWWLPASETRANLDVMRKVLDGLVERGLLERIGSGDRAHYRLKKSMLDA